jgi:UDPglucose 6-dehydrogenase
LKKKESITVFGLGKVGSAIVSVSLEKKYQVYGFDTDELVKSKFKNGDFETQEPFVTNTIEKFRNNFKIIEDTCTAINNSLLSIIIVPTPSTTNGDFDSTHVEEAVTQIIAALNCKDFKKINENKNFSHSIIVASTVSPETMRKKIYPILKNLKTELLNKVELVYSPEFIALGSVVKNLKSPEFILLGHCGKGVSNKLLKYKKKINENKAEIHLASYESAEIAKISVNTFLTTKISYANMISELIYETKNSNQAEVFRILKSDSRIGKKFFNPGLGYGGPCLPRDNRALIAFSKTKKLNSPIASSTDEMNNKRPSSVARQINSFLIDKKTILILGVTYKSGTNSVEESHAAKVIECLNINPENIIIHDFNHDFSSKKIWEKYKTINGEIPEPKFDGIICLIDDTRYINYLQKHKIINVFKAYDLSI